MERVEQPHDAFEVGMTAESLRALIELGAEQCCRHCREGDWPERFDALLTEVERAAAEKAWHEGSVFGQRAGHGGSPVDQSAYNPYREGKR